MRPDWKCVRTLALALSSLLIITLPSNAQDNSSHEVHFVTVEPGVKLEVLDWGGTGSPVVLISGSGNTAHVFDSFAPKLASTHRVYGITRRGFGKSDKPSPTPDNYDANRLGDDVLAVLNSLKIDKPILIGHSFGGSELSSIGSRAPERVAGLVYLEGGYSYAFYFPDVDASVEPEANNLRRALTLLPNTPPSQLPPLLAEIRSELAMVSSNLRWYDDYAAAADKAEEPTPSTPEQKVVEALALGERKFTEVKPPILAIFAMPQYCEPSCGTPIKNWQSGWTKRQAAALEKAYPKARIVRLPNAKHLIWRSNEEDVLREINVFLDRLH